MFWNEFDSDCTITTILDESDKHQDVQLIIDDTTVWIRQFNSEDTGADLIMMTPKMFKDMIAALDQPEGMFKTEYVRDK